VAGGKKAAHSFIFTHFRMREYELHEILEAALARLNHARIKVSDQALSWEFHSTNFLGVFLCDCCYQSKQSGT
jgi:hypothetical protein